MGQPTPDFAALADQVLGYVNFSAGQHDPSFFRTLSGIFERVASRHSDRPVEPEDASTESAATEAAATEATPAQALPSVLADGDAETIVPPVWQRVHRSLACRLEELQRSQDAFRNSSQASAALSVAFEHVLPMYRRRHEELVFGKSDDFLFNSFFVGRVIECALRELVQQANGAAYVPDDYDAASLAEVVFGNLNDYLGHRPVAALETRKIEPYREEWIRPVPLLIRDAGLAESRYREVIERAVSILNDTDSGILQTAQFDPQRLAELAIDPRAFDFDHPANKRPNYHFGQWDEHSVDNAGYFTRFVLHNVTLDAVLGRVNDAAADPTQPLDREEALTEAGAVLAGTILMAAGVSGRGPGAHDSHTTLATLLPVIAGYRDQFYTDLLRRLPTKHRQRLQAELKTRQQPFGAARQDLNARLSQRRASQLVNCRVASIYARMGYPETALKQLSAVPVASARIVCQIDCLLGTIRLAMQENRLEDAVAAIPKTVALLKRGIQCGAIVDPWNILGFDANYSLFPALENTVRDHRVYELVDLVERIFAACSELWSEAAARDDEALCKSIRNDFLNLAEWWRQFAAHEVMSVEAVDALENFEAAQLVAEALNLWHKGGAAAGDISFWSQHAELFDSPKAYSLVISALMQRDDYQTASALLIHWVSRADEIPLQIADSSFHGLVDHWTNHQRERLLEMAPLAPSVPSIPPAGRPQGPTGVSDDAPSPSETREAIWNRIRKFYDYIEANAEQYWEVPDFRVGTSGGQPPALADDDSIYDEADPDEDGDNNDLFRAAYDDVVYTDSTDDGVDGEIFGEEDSTDEALVAEVDRVLDRLEFLETVAGFWRVSATVPLPVTRSQDLTPAIERSLKSRHAIILNWLAQAVKHRDQLTKLVDSINEYQIPQSGSDHDAMLRYDEHRAYRDALLEQAIHSNIETQNAIRLLSSVVHAINLLLEQPMLGDTTAIGDEATAVTTVEVDTTPEGKSPEYESDNARLVSVFSAVLLESPQLVTENFEDFLGVLHRYPLLYVPLARGGNPGSIICARTLQTHLLDLLHRLPALGLLTETHDLLRTALRMERDNPIGQGAVTEFDELFEVGYTAMVHSLVRSSDQLRIDLIEQNPADPDDAEGQAETQLFDCIEMLTESLLIHWLEHGKTLRLSVLEKVLDSKPDGPWEQTVDFIQRYGSGLFTQQFMHAGNVRGILRHGVAEWLEQAVLDPPNELDTRLFEELGNEISHKQATWFLTMILEAVIENYNEYRDYNTTTTQSDHGGSLYMLLDFLRLRARYDRVVWKLKPVTWAHRILVREEKNVVARMWRRSLMDRVSGEADKFMASYQKLRQKYSMQMASVGRRIEGRFVSQMQIDRLRSQVGPAMADPTERRSRRAFERLHQEAQAFTRTTTGVGVDLPAWLAALESEVEQFQMPDHFRDLDHHRSTVSTGPVSIANLREQLENLSSQESR